MWCHMVHIDRSPGIGLSPLALGKTLTSAQVRAAMPTSSYLKYLSYQRSVDTHAGTSVWRLYSSVTNDDRAARTRCILPAWRGHGR